MHSVLSFETIKEINNVNKLVENRKIWIGQLEKIQSDIEKSKKHYIKYIDNYLSNITLKDKKIFEELSDDQKLDFAIVLCEIKIYALKKSVKFERYLKKEIQFEFSKSNSESLEEVTERIRDKFDFNIHAMRMNEIKAIKEAINRLKLPLIEKNASYCEDCIQLFTTNPNFLKNNIQFESEITKEYARIFDIEIERRKSLNILQDEIMRVREIVLNSLTKANAIEPTEVEIVFIKKTLETFLQEFMSCQNEKIDECTQLLEDLNKFNFESDELFGDSLSLDEGFGLEYVKDTLSDAALAEEEHITFKHKNLSQMDCSKRSNPFKKATAHDNFKPHGPDKKN